ncbi:MAG: sodium:proton antiporter NhaD, partial [Paracoccaceae bacterium]
MDDLDLTGHWAGIAGLVIFVLAYTLVILEEATHLRKSVPVVLAAGLIWVLIGWAYGQAGQAEAAHEAALHIIEEYGALLLFLLVAITYVNVLEERRAFDALRGWLVGLGLGYRPLFLLTGVIAFFLSSVLDNLTTALVMGAVVLALGRDSPRFVAVGCVSIVVAANAGGAFSPFGDITTLMVWQAGKLEFFEFFALFLPSLVNWLVPAAILY